MLASLHKQLWIYTSRGYIVNRDDTLESLPFISNDCSALICEIAFWGWWGYAQLELNSNCSSDRFSPMCKGRILLSSMLKYEMDWDSSNLLVARETSPFPGDESQSSDFLCIKSRRFRIHIGQGSWSYSTVSFPDLWSYVYDRGLADSRIERLEVQIIGGNGLQYNLLANLFDSESQILRHLHEWKRTQLDIKHGRYQDISRHSSQSSNVLEDMCTIHSPWEYIINILD